MFAPPSPWRPQSARLFTFPRHKRRICNTCTRAAPTSLYQHGIFMQQLITTSTEATSENLPFVATTAALFLGHNPGLSSFFGHLLLTAFPLIISEVAALNCQQLSSRLMATDRKNVPCQVSSDRFNRFFLNLFFSPALITSAPCQCVTLQW